MTSLKEQFKGKEVYLYIFIAYIFSIMARLIWVWMNGDNVQFFWNDQFMINTNDGYYWAEGARDIIAGFHQDNDDSPVTEMASWLTAILYWVTPFSLETVIFYMPSFLGSLVVIPVILIGRALGQLHVGFIAALLSSIAWSYYNRTMIGYYDSDMLNIVLPVLLLWSLVLAFKTHEDRYLVFMAIDIIVYRLWYPQSYSVEFAFFGLILFYVLFFERKNRFLIKLLTMLILAMMGLPTLARIALVIGFYFISKRAFYEKYFYYFLAAAGGLFLYSGGLNPIITLVKIYVLRDVASVTQEGLSLHYVSVLQTVREAARIPFEHFANRISGHTVIFILSTIGYFWFAWRHKIMLLALPLVGLGFLAYGIPGVISGGGLRFTIYAIVPLAFGIGYLIVELSRWASDNSQQAKKPIYWVLVLSMTIAILYPNVKHIYEYQVPTVMTSNEVNVLDEYKKIAQREDYTLAWWDYGYPIRFYADTKTFADGAKHSGAQNFPVSIALTEPQSSAANIARMTAEDMEARYKAHKEAEAKGETYVSKLTHMQELFTKNDLGSTDDLLTYLKNTSSDMNKSMDIYFYLPLAMARLYPTIEKFKSIDLVSGKEKNQSLFQLYPMRDAGDRILFSNTLFLSKRDGQLYNGNRKVPLRVIYQTKYTQSNKLEVKKTLVNMAGNVNILLLSSYGMAIILDDAALNSTFVQLFFLEQYDKKYFEPAIISPYAKIYKLKI